VKWTLAIAMLVACACSTTGCGGSTARSQLATGGEPPAWLEKIVAREDKLFNDRGPGGDSYSLTGKTDVVEVFGEFTTSPPGPRCASAHCRHPFRVHGTFLRLVVSPRTHRLVSVFLGHEIAPTQAPPIARRSNRYLEIFSPTPGKIACSIPRGGMQLIGTPGFPGRCTTEFAFSGSLHGRAIRIRFGERWHSDHQLQIAGWIVTVSLRNGRVQSTQVIGQPPQLWK
jgi:hypothetical protein